MFPPADSSLVNVLSHAGVSQALPTLGLPFPPAVGRELSSLFKQNISVYLPEKTFVWRHPEKNISQSLGSAFACSEVFIDTAGRRNPQPLLRRILQKFPCLQSVQELGKPLCNGVLCRAEGSCCWHRSSPAAPTSRGVSSSRSQTLHETRA